MIRILIYIFNRNLKIPELVSGRRDYTHTLRNESTQHEFTFPLENLKFIEKYRYFFRKTSRHLNRIHITSSHSRYRIEFTHFVAIFMDQFLILCFLNEVPKRIKHVPHDKALVQSRKSPTTSCGKKIVTSSKKPYFFLGKKSLHTYRPITKKITWPKDQVSSTAELFCRKKKDNFWPALYYRDKNAPSFSPFIKRTWFQPGSRG